MLSCLFLRGHKMLFIPFYSIDLPPTHRPPPPYNVRPLAAPQDSHTVASFSQVGACLGLLTGVSIYSKMTVTNVIRFCTQWLSIFSPLQQSSSVNYCPLWTPFSLICLILSPFGTHIISCLPVILDILFQHTRLWNIPHLQEMILNINDILSTMAAFDRDEKTVRCCL